MLINRSSRLPDVLEQRRNWFASQLDLDPAKLVFVDVVAGLRLRGLAPKVYDRPMNAALFEEWVEKCLVPTLSQGDGAVRLFARLDRPAGQVSVRPSASGFGCRFAMFFTTCLASREEKRRAMPADSLVPAPMGVVTHAVTINASPDRVWPWLAQMGAGRAGWYSYDWIDNGGHPCAGPSISMSLRATSCPQPVA